MGKEFHYKDMISKLCVNYYEDFLPKRGKPQANREWTILAGVVQARSLSSAIQATGATSSPESTRPANARHQKEKMKKHEIYEGVKYEVVAIGTGSKCLGLDKLSRTGVTVHDSHAEVVARRAFLRYLYDQLKKSILKEDSIFDEVNTDGEFKLKPDVKFHFFTSQTPCGDASIFGDMRSLESETVPILKNSEQTDLVEISHNVLPHTDTKCNISKIVSEKIDTPDGKMSSSDTVSQHCKSEPEGLVGNVEAGCYTTMDCGSKRMEQASSLLSTEERKESASPLIVGCGSSKRKGDASACDFASPAKAVKITKTEDELDVSETRSSNHKYKDHRTGAKCVPGEIQDPLRTRGYHSVGVLRLKPGRGSRSLSLCCSDKIAKWNVLGCQGALLSHFLVEPIVFTSIVIGKCSYDEDATKRALLKRIDGVHSSMTFAVHNDVSIFYSDVEFCHSKEYVQRHYNEALGKLAPCGTAINWSAVSDSALEVSVKGIRQGITKKDENEKKARCNICKSKLFETFKELIHLIPYECLPHSLKIRSTE